MFVADLATGCILTEALALNIREQLVLCVPSLHKRQTTWAQFGNIVYYTIRCFYCTHNIICNYRNTTYGKTTSYFLTLDPQHISIKSVYLFDYVVLDYVTF